MFEMQLRTEIKAGFDRMHRLMILNGGLLVALIVVLAIQA